MNTNSSLFPYEKDKEKKDDKVENDEKKEDKEENDEKKEEKKEKADKNESGEGTNDKDEKGDKDPLQGIYIFIIPRYNV